MTIRLRLGFLIAALGLAGCQTVALDPDPTMPSEPPVGEIAALSTNELNRLGRRDLAAGFSGKAERFFRTAVEKNADDASSWIGLAAAYDNLRRFDLADRAYEQAIRLEGQTIAIVNNRGYSYLLRGDTRRALQQFRRAQAIDPTNPVIANNILLLRSGERPTRATPL